MRKILEQDKIIKEGVHYEFHLYNGDWDIYLVEECQKLGPDYLDIRRHWAVLRNGTYNKTVQKYLIQMTAIIVRANWNIC